MLIEKIKTKQLIPAEYNPRKDLKPGDPEYEKLKRSLEEFGYVEPVIWNKTTGRVIGGHQPVSYTHLDVYKRQTVLLPWLSRAD